LSGGIDAGGVLITTALVTKRTRGGERSFAADVGSGVAARHRVSPAAASVVGLGADGTGTMTEVVRAADMRGSIIAGLLVVSHLAQRE